MWESKDCRFCPKAGGGRWLTFEAAEEFRHFFHHLIYFKMKGENMAIVKILMDEGFGQANLKVVD
ncbi:MAG: hypothetical protein KDC57_18995, partial [Saprospiraceae bacterium]|nr:hypothetical protein [Saprospiraceae bacterium]